MSKLVILIMADGPDYLPTWVSDVAKAALKCSPDGILILLGECKESVIDDLWEDLSGEQFVKIQFIDQDQHPVGTNHIISNCLPALSHYDDDTNVIILPGDMSLITDTLINDILTESFSKCLITAADIDDTFDAGYVVIDNDEKFDGFVEHKIRDKKTLVNCDIYVFKKKILRRYIQLLDNDDHYREIASMINEVDICLLFVN